MFSSSVTPAVYLNVSDNESMVRGGCNRNMKDVILLLDVHMNWEIITSVLVTRVKGYRGGPSLWPGMTQCLCPSRESPTLSDCLISCGGNSFWCLLSLSRPLGVCRVYAVHLYIYYVYRSRGIPGRFHPMGGKKRNENNYRIHSLLFWNPHMGPLPQVE